MGEGFPQIVPGVAAGSRIGGYLLEEQIGHGGMAVVFRALDERLERQVALKILAPALAADQSFRHRFVRESRAAAAVDDPNIIPVFEAGEADGVLFIAMRYVRGGDVRSLLFREGALAPGRAAGIISPVASALDAAHSAGLVHRDVKPANMLLDARPGRPEHVYLSDFGLSKEALGSVGLTGSGQFLGTVDYASPEQIEGRPVDGKADQYALACAAFEMLCNDAPFRRDQGMAVLFAHVSEPPPVVTARNSALPSSLDPVLARAMAKSPGDRYETCGEFSDALREALGIGRYHSAPRASYPETELAWPARGLAIGNTAAMGAADGMTQAPSPLGTGSGAPTSPVTSPAMLRGNASAAGGRAAPRWLIAVASAATAAAVVALAFGAMALTHNSQGTHAAGFASTAGTSGVGGTSNGNPQASGSAQISPTPSQAVTSGTPTTSATPTAAAAGPANTWIAQLASVPFAEGPAHRDAVLANIRLQIPGAQVVSSADYASLTPGYWMIYFDGSFADGTQALDYCAGQGRTTSQQCFGTFLSHSAADRTTRCYPTSPNAPACYYHA